MSQSSVGVAGNNLPLTTSTPIREEKFSRLCNCDCRSHFDLSWHFDAHTKFGVSWVAGGMKEKLVVYHLLTIKGVGDGCFELGWGLRYRGSCSFAINGNQPRYAYCILCSACYLYMVSMWTFCTLYPLGRCVWIEVKLTFWLPFCLQYCNLQHILI